MLEAGCSKLGFPVPELELIGFISLNAALELMVFSIHEFLAPHETTAFALVQPGKSSWHML